MKFIAYLSFFLIITSCIKKQSQELKMSIILRDNQNPNSEWTKKIIIKDSIISLDSALIDLYFINEISRIPFYLPSNGIFRDSIKDNECKTEIYPANVKCYEYDNKGRVIKMSVNGSGTMGDWIYKYDSLNRVIEIKRFATTYSVKYKEGLNLLTELALDGGLIQKRIEINYENN